MAATGENRRMKQEGVNKKTEPERRDAGIREAVSEAQLLVAYVAHEGLIDVDREALDIFVRSKCLLQRGTWTAADEIAFWRAYDRMSALIKPVTIETLRSTMPVYREADQGGKQTHTPAGRAVTRYKILAGISLAILLLVQIYWLIGSNLNKNLKELMNARKTAGLEIRRVMDLKGYAPQAPMKEDLEISQMKTRLEILNQKLDANYELLLGWNRVWQAMLGVEQFKSEVTPYVQLKFDEELKHLEKRIKERQDRLDGEGAADPAVGTQAVALKTLRTELRERRLQHELDKSRNKLFLTEISAGFVLGALQIYLLPLLYGFLGAATYVLRTLSDEIRSLTYSNDSEIRYRLRLSVGALAGIMAGWFLRPDSTSALGSFSSLAVAFLMGYNVEVLFSVMDKIIAGFSKWKPAATAA